MNPVTTEYVLTTKFQPGVTKQFGLKCRLKIQRMIMMMTTWVWSKNKMIKFWHLLVDSEEWENIKANNEDTEKMFEMKMDEIKTSVHGVRINVGKMRHFQFMLGAQMSKVQLIAIFANQEKLFFTGYSSSWSKFGKDKFLVCCSFTDHGFGRLHTGLDYNLTLNR